MQLNGEGLKNTEEWKKAGYLVPEFDRDALTKATFEQPEWIHFGAGNIFKAFLANVWQKLLNRGEAKTGILAVGGREMVEKLNRLTDDYSVLATLKADGSVEKTVIGSVVKTMVLDRAENGDLPVLSEIFRAPTLKMASFTITEKGYALKDPDGAYLPAIARDLEAGPEKASSYLGLVCMLLYERYLAGGAPVAMVSMDNCSHNGDKLRAAMETIAACWEEKALVKEGFLAYLQDPAKVSFPWSMIDKITPRPDPKVKAMLEEDGLKDLDLIVTSRGSYLSKFVNAEESEYLVIEDHFPAGKLPLDKEGIIYTDRETVDKVEKMKVCTCLNPVHTSLAVFGCLLGYEKIFEEMKDPQLRTLAETVGRVEGLPVVTDPGIIRPEDFLNEVLTRRVPNPFMPDSPQRIATDTSQKIPIRFGETVKAYLRSDPSEIEKLRAIPLVYAGWIRYLMGIDDELNAFTPSSDPLLDYLQKMVSGLEIGKTDGVEEVIRPLLENDQIFGINLYEAGLAGRVTAYLEQMLKGKGAVRAALVSVLG